MRRSILILIYTYFQLITAIHLKRTEFASDDVDVIITDQSKGSADVAFRLRKIQLFRRVFFVHDSDGLDETRELDKCKRYLSAWLHPERALKKYIFLSDSYNIFLFHNASLLTHLIGRHYRKSVKFFRFDEGYSTYTRPLLDKKPLHRWMIRWAFGDLNRRICGIYLFHPELFQQKVNYPIFRIQLLGSADTGLKQILNQVFHYVPDPHLLHADYIFLEEAASLFSSETGDLDLLCKIAGVVGEKRLAVKQHPRSPEYPLNIHGIPAVQSGNIPWEVILMNEDFSEKTLLTIMSGTALAPVLYGYKPIKTYLLFQCVQSRPAGLNGLYLDYIRQASKLGALIIPEDQADFFAQLTEQEMSARKKKGTSIYENNCICPDQIE